MIFDFITFIEKFSSLKFSRSEYPKIPLADAIKSFLEHLHNHKDFFESEGGPKILSIEAQIGLFGEVFFLNEILSNKINIIEANNYWTGPYKKYDFTTLKIFLETKTSTSIYKQI